MSDSSKAIRVNVIKAAAHVSPDAELHTPLSVYMYLAGLVVSLSGIYAVTYDMADTRFATILRVLVVIGYYVSYLLRRHKVDLKQYQAPLLVVFATVMYFVASTSPSLTDSGSSGAVRPYEIQTVIVWIAVLQSFTLVTDSAILFACVPSMALIGIMSTGTPDTEVQYAFVVFLASATFLMVHENHLRTRTRMAFDTGAHAPQSQKLVSGEFALVTVCVAATMLIAVVVAEPIQIVGHAMIPPGAQDALNNLKKQNTSSSNIRVEEPADLDLGMGPRTQSDAELLEITSSSPEPYWRGATYDYYTGNRFEDSYAGGQPVEPSSHSPVPGMSSTTVGEPLVGRFRPQRNEYQFDATRWDLGDGVMDHSTLITQVVKIAGGTMNHIYAAPSFQNVTSPYSSLDRTLSGSLAAPTFLSQGSTYAVVSRVPCMDPPILRGAGSDYRQALGTALRKYLQVDVGGVPENARLKQFALSCVQGKTNEYDQVVAIRDAVAKQCTYNIQAPAIPRDRDVVEAFLFDSKQGYCDMFAAAVTVLCRYAGIPARLATGFAAGDLMSNSVYIVREKHKHAWTEVYFPHIGWVPFEATEGTVDATPTSAAGDGSQLNPLRWLLAHGPGPILLFFAVVGMLGYVIYSEMAGRKRRLTPTIETYQPLPLANMEIIRTYRNACAVLARHGLPRSASHTPAEFCAEVGMQLSDVPAAAQTLDEITALHQRFSYGPQRATPADAEAARSALTRLSAALRSLKRPARTQG